MSGTAPVLAQPYSEAEAETTPWTEARQHSAAADTDWLATVNPDGRPHVVPLLAVWVDGVLHFVASPESRKAGNSARDPRCTITTRGGLDLVLEREARTVRDDAALQRVAATYAAKDDWPVESRDGAFYADGAPTVGRRPPTFTRSRQREPSPSLRTNRTGRRAGVLETKEEQWVYRRCPKPTARRSSPRPTSPS